MITVPSKAKELICPFITDSEIIINCEGDKCMAWVQIEIPANNGMAGLANEGVVELRPKEYNGVCGRLCVEFRSHK